MSFKKVGLFSYEDGKEFFETLQKNISTTLKHIKVAGNSPKAIAELCQNNEFDCVILIDELVDSCRSRKKVEEIIKEIEESCCKVIVLSIWDDTPGNLILVEQKEPVLNKCQKIMEHI